MVIQIRIPQNIINTCKECGWSELETKEYFSRYMREVMEDPYGQFEHDFNWWLEDLDEEEEESDEEYNSLTAKLYCPANNQ
jgi:hypothetical protein